MRFWDSSALVPLLVPETTSAAVHAVRRADPDLVVWWAAEVECASAFHRRNRAGAVPDPLLNKLIEHLRLLTSGCETILPSDVVRERSLRALAIHPLGASDALQLASALIWARERPSGVGFVCLDTRLRCAAQREGFTVLP